MTNTLGIRSPASTLNKNTPLLSSDNYTSKISSLKKKSYENQFDEP